MVALVLVGHSAQVVAGVAAMVAQAAPGVPVEVAGGLSGERLGTSGPDVLAALQRALAASAGRGVVVLLDLGSAALALDIALQRALAASAGRGVVVLLDLGSAALALDIALDELDAPERAAVRVTEAPFLEGAVVGAVAAAGGADVDVVVAAAEGAMRMPKLPHRG